MTRMRSFRSFTCGWKMRWPGKIGAIRCPDIAPHARTGYRSNRRSKPIIIRACKFQDMARDRFRVLVLHHVSRCRDGRDSKVAKNRMQSRVRAVAAQTLAVIGEFAE